MPIKVVRAVSIDIFRATFPAILIIPFFLTMAYFLVLPMVGSIKDEYITNLNMTDPFLAEQAMVTTENTLTVFYVITGIAIIIPLIQAVMRTNVSRILKTANMEKRMLALKKLGAKKFIKETNAELLDESERGNKLYKSDKIIKGREVKFLIYNDKSTDREYISFVDASYFSADEAMASKFSLGEFEYKKLKNEA